VTVKNLTKEITIESIEDYFKKDRKPKTITHIDYIFPEERKTHSVMIGLLTSLGSKLWEKLAKELASRNHFSVLNEKDFNANVPQPLPSKVVSLLHKYRLSMRSTNKDLSGLPQELRDLICLEGITSEGSSKITKGEGVDIWLKKNDQEFMYDLKTVQVNAGSGEKYTNTLCNWHAYRILQDNSVKLNTAVVFPYDPHQGNFWKKEGGKAAPLKPGSDALLGDQFWGFISGEENPLGKMFEAFKEIGEENILEKFKHKFH